MFSRLPESWESFSSLVIFTCPTYPSLLQTQTSLSLCEFRPNVGAAQVNWSPERVLRTGIRFRKSGGAFLSSARTGKKIGLWALSFCYSLKKGYLTHFLFDLRKGVLPPEPPLRVREDERHGLHAVRGVDVEVQVHGLLRVRVLPFCQLSIQLLHQLSCHVVQILVRTVESGCGVTFFLAKEETMFSKLSRSLESHFPPN